MRYGLSTLRLERLIAPVAAAEAALARLDERLGCSDIRAGWIQRMDFADACAAVWLEGDLVHLEDLVLHDAGMDARAPTHAVARAATILRSRRRLAATHAGWGLAPQGFGDLAGRAGEEDKRGEARGPDEPRNEAGQGDFDSELAAMDEALARAQAALTAPVAVATTRRGQPLYDEDWDEDARMGEWRAVLGEVQDLPPLLAASLLWDAWHVIEPLQRRSWLGAHVIADVLRVRGAARHHLPTLHAWLRYAPFERRRAADRTTRVLAFLDAVIAGADQGRKDHDRWLLARTMLRRKLAGRRSTSRLGALIDLIVARPVVSSGMICRALKITPRAALTLLDELDLREITGRKMYRAWAVL